MTEKDNIKAKALGKLDELVREAIRVYNDTGIVDVLKIVTPKDTNIFSPEQYEEIRRNLENINNSLSGLVNYCRDRDIDIPKDVFDVKNIDITESFDESIAEDELD